MCRTFILYLACGGFALLSQLPADKPAQAQEKVRIAPASGGVELDEINIVRRTALGAVKEADLTNMELRFWFPADWKRKDKDFRPLIRLHALDPIEDDTGKLLSTDSRLKQIECLRGEVRGKRWTASGGNEGPVASLVLEAPARKADKIKAIKGKAEVSLAKTVEVGFSDLSAISGKELDHPDVKALQDLKLRFSIEEKDGNVSAKLTAPFYFASPWNLGRLEAWELFDGKKRIRLSSESVSPDKDGVTVERTYERQSFKGWSLRLIILDPVESKTFNFDFKNVELP